MNTESKLHPLAVIGPTNELGGRLKGYCYTTYSALCVLLGPPHVEYGDKTTVEWAFSCNDGTVFTVTGSQIYAYDWKQSSTPTAEYRWHIGGSDKALDAFHRFTGLNTIALV